MQNAVLIASFVKLNKIHIEFICQVTKTHSEQPKVLKIFFTRFGSFTRRRHVDRFKELESLLTARIIADPEFLKRLDSKMAKVKIKNEKSAKTA